MNALRRTSIRTLVRSFSEQVRVRFAPSPTGFLHLGGLRTALYNHLYAASHGGRTVLRIEDTDRSRTVEGAVESLIENLEWAGLRFDESPTAGGDHGPYIQSQRLHIYQKEVQNLLDTGAAYKCFCTERRLNLLRREALRTRQVPKYDNKCRHLSSKEIRNRTFNGDPYCIRFKLTSDIKHFEDLIYANVAYDVTLTEGDPVIMKSDSFPTYHLANVVDDHYMNISHVLRGVEWQISTTKHLLMYRAFGWKPPFFGHLPLIMNADGTKLSKRQSDVRVEDHRKNGVLPNALINYITLTGGGFVRTQGEGVSLYSFDELTQQFHLNLVNSNSSRLNPDLLKECNRLAIIEHVKEDKDVLTTELKNIVKNKFHGKNVDISDDYVKSVLLWSSGRITSLEDLISPSLAFLWVLPNPNGSLDDKSKEHLTSLYQILKADKIDFKHPTLKSFLRDFAKEKDIRFKDFMGLMREVLCGLNEGPSVAEIMEILGKEMTLRRLSNAIENENLIKIKNK